MPRRWSDLVRTRLVVGIVGAGLIIAFWINLGGPPSMPGASAAEVATGLPSETGWDEVHDVETGQRYLTQTIELYLPGLPSAVTGDFEYIRAPASEVVELQSSLGLVETPWVFLEPGPVTVLSWSSDDVVFGVPRPRQGVETNLQGDTLIVILHLDTGLEMRAVVRNDTLGGLRNSAVERVETELTVGPFADAD